jgi:hypothetical protein
MIAKMTVSKSAARRRRRKVCTFLFNRIRIVTEQSSILNEQNKSSRQLLLHHFIKK